MLLQESYFYFTSRALICSILEYRSPVFIQLYQVMISYLSEDQERLQKRAMKILYPELSYCKALELSGLLHCIIEERQMRQSCSVKYVLINLTVSTNYFQVNTSQATLSENKEHLFVQSVKLKDARIVFF